MRTEVQYNSNGWYAIFINGARVTEWTPFENVATCKHGGKSYFALSEYWAGCVAFKTDKVYEVVEVPQDTWAGVYPGMCMNPNLCRDKTHCPRNPSCCE